MEIKQFQLHNLGRFQSLKALLAPTNNISSKVTVFVGNNGSGKTSVLKALATSLSWFVARLRTEKGSGSPIPEDVIFNDASFSAIDIQLQDDNFRETYASDVQSKFEWRISKARTGKKAELTSQLNDASKLADLYRTRFTADDKSNFPLVAFYSVERVVLDIPIKIRGRHTFFQLDAYDNSLSHGVDFRRFFEWFREREDSENETGIPEGIFNKLLESIDQKSDIWKKLEEHVASSRDRQLVAVRTAISNFMPGFKNLRVRRKPRLHMSIDKDSKTFNVLQLSQGEKSLMALVGDIARRLAMLNPSMENPLHGDGVILIDEVDMHLHPTWQRNIIERLTSTFPNCQFVLTTHSPLVISDCKDILVYSLYDGELTEVPSQYGEDANTVLLGVMDTHIRNAAITEKLNSLLDLIQDNQLDQAKSELILLEEELSENNLELTKAKMLLRKQELKHAQNR